MNILVSKVNFDEPWAYNTLKQWVTADLRVAVLPLSFWDAEVYSPDTWNQVYQPDGKYYKEIARVFSGFGIHARRITFINYFKDNALTIKRVLDASDILFLPGGAPDLTMKRIFEMGIADFLRAYRGIVIGCSAGAMVQCNLFHITPNLFYPDFCHQDGLGMLPKDIGVEVHYVPDDTHIEYLQRTVRETGRTILLLDNHSGAVFLNGEWVLMGNAAFYTDRLKNGE